MVNPMPLRPGSSAARAVYRIMSGAPVTTLITGRGVDAHYDGLCTVLTQLAANVFDPTRLTVVLPEAEAAAVRRRVDELENALHSRGFPDSGPTNWYPTTAGKDLEVVLDARRSLNVSLIHLNMKYGNRAYGSLHLKHLYGLMNPVDLLIITDDPQRRLAPAAQLIAARQILYISEGRGRPRGIRPSSPPGGTWNWGQIPLEVILAAGRS